MSWWRAPSENREAGDRNDEQMARVSPMRQVPALVLPNGELLTESAAILALARAPAALSSR